ncbi:MAG: autotransporter outer membrane beta-barrel domain-containing protein [Acidaminococcaceae bacterium]|nr:autotransporter outer membrane beta-barrel domain-containing protein [Acidaminococcaceae bacterium]
MKKTTKSAILAAIFATCFGTSVNAANLLGVVVTDAGYQAGKLAVITGSRVTTHVDRDAAKDYVTDLNRDASLYPFVYDGNGMIALRQYTYSTTDLAPTRILDGNGDWNIPVYEGVFNSVANMHAAAAHNGYIYGTGYDLGKIGVEKIQENGTTTETFSVDLKNIINTHCGGSYDATVSGVHGESLMVRDGKLYAVASVNPNGGYTPYDDSYLIQFEIKPDGSLKYVSHVRTAKNPDNVRTNYYNGRIFVTGIGGSQGYGSNNPDSGLSVAEMSGGKLSSSRKIKVPRSVRRNGCDFRNLKILPNGTAYVLMYVLSNAGQGSDTKVYKTTVSNLLAENPQDWELVVDEVTKGWFNNLDAEYYTKRLYMECGNNVWIYTDGEKSPLIWTPRELTNDDSFVNFNGWAVAPADNVAGLQAVRNDLHVSSITQKALAQADFRCKITGTSADNGNAQNKYNYVGFTDDFKNYTFNTDKTVYVYSDLSGDLTTNVLAAVDAHAGNDVKINSNSNTLQLQAMNVVGNPAGIYAGNGKNVVIDAGKVDIKTMGIVKGNSLTNAVWLDAPKTGTSNIIINAPVNITMEGGLGGNGIAVQKTDRWGESSMEAEEGSSITINGDVTILGNDNKTWGIPLNMENVFSRFNNAGVLTSVDKSKVTINGNVDFSIYGNGITANAAGSSISVGGGKIVVPSGTGYSYYALGAYQGNIDMNSNGSAAGTRSVQLDGDIFALKTGIINLGLTTADSYLKGVVDNGGAVNMWLTDGAVWTDKANNKRYIDDNEDIGSGAISRVTNLYGGSSKDKRGVINASDSAGISVDNYNGNAVVLYAHEAANPKNIKGGDINIRNAAAGSEITLRTDNTGIDTSDKTLVVGVLSGLANKLYYEGYVSGERNLKGSVDIAEGLTGSAVQLKLGHIAYDKATGQGSYVSDEHPPQDKKLFTTTITGTAADTEYIKHHVLIDGAYKFTLGGSEVDVDGNAVDALADTVISNSSTSPLTLDGSENAVKANGYKVSVSGQTALVGDLATGKHGEINIQDVTSWIGNYNSAEGKAAVTLKKGAVWTGASNAGEFTLNMQEGATWNNNGVSVIKNVIKGTLNNNGTLNVSANDLRTITNNIGELNLGSGELLKGISGSGTTVIDGEVTAKEKIANAITVNSGKQLKIGADSVGGAVANSGTLTLTDGTLAKAVSGSGTTVINGNVTADGKIANNIKIDNGKQLRIGVADVGGAVANSGTLTLNTDGALTEAVSGSGTTVIAGNVTADEKIANNIKINSGKTLRINTENLGGNITNDGTLSLNNGGTISKAIDGGGTTVIASGTEVALDEGASVGAASSLNIKGKLTANGKLQNAGNLSIGSTGSLDLRNKKTEQLSVSNFTSAGGKLSFDAALDSGAGDSISVSGKAEGTLNLESVNVTSETAGGVGETTTITLISGDNNSMTVNGTETVLGAYKYIFTQDASDKGKLKVTKENGYTLQEVINDSVPEHKAGKVATYSYVGGYTSAGDLGTLTRPDAAVRILTINGNNSVFDGGGHKGVTVNNGDTLKLTGISELKNFSGAAVKNAGNLNFTAGDALLNADVEGTGATIISGASVNLGSGRNLEQQSLNISAGSLRSGAEQLHIADGVIRNDGTLELTGGTLGQEIKGDGTTVIDGEVIANQKIGNTVTINVSKQLNADAANVGGAVDNSGILRLTDGALAAVVSGSGTTVIDGEVTDKEKIANAITVNNGKQLKIGAGNIGGAVANSGTMRLADGTLAAAVSGSGVTVIDGEVTAKEKIANAIAVNSGKQLKIGADNVGGAVTNSGTLTLTDGILAKAVSGTGGTVGIAGHVTLAANITGQTVDVKSGTLVVNAATDYLGVTNNLLLRSGAVLDMQDEHKSINSITAGNFTAENGSSLKMDMQLSNSTNDMINTGTASGKLTVSSINLKDGFEGEAGTEKRITLVSGDASGLQLNGTSTNLGQYKYVFTDDGNGVYKVTKEYGYTLQQVVQNSAEGAGTIDTYSFNNDLISDSDIGILTRQDASVARTLSVNGNGNTLNGGGHGGFIVNDKDTLNLSNMTLWNFNGAAVKNVSTDTVNLDGVVFEGNTMDLSNDGVVNISGVSALDKGITGSGTVNITAAVATGEATKLEQKRVNIGSSGSIGLNADNLKASDGILNDGSLTLTGGMNKNSIRGNGTVNISGAVTNDAALKNDLNIASEGTYIGNASVKGDVTNNGILHLNLTRGKIFSGALFNNGTAEMNLSGGLWERKGEETAVLNALTGGVSRFAPGFIRQQKGAGGLDIGTLNGYVNVAVDYEKGAVQSGDVTVHRAGSGANIRMQTLSSNVDMSSGESIKKALDDMARKLLYTNEDGKKTLEATTAIAEGITSSFAMKAGKVFFDANNRGYYGAEHVDSDIIYGDEETKMMKGVKSSVIGINMLWRNLNNDVQKRMGDIRLAEEEDGIWANYNGGRLSYAKGGTDTKHSYNGAQVGYDKALGSNWHAGVALSRMKGSGAGVSGGTDEKLSALSLYGTWQGTGGHYADFILKGSHAESDFRVYNDMGVKLAGDASRSGLSFSAEYGIRMKRADGFYIEPQAEMSLGRLKGENFVGKTETMGNMYVQTEDFNSVLGRLGLSFGVERERYSFYGKISLLHEFAGEFTTVYGADSGPTKNNKVDLSGSWASFQLGATAKLRENSYLYANFEKTAGGACRTDWRADIGARFSF